MVLNKPLLASAGAAVAVGVVMMLASLRYWFSRRRVCHGSNAGELRKPIRAILANPDNIAYHRKSHNVPKRYGGWFRLGVWLLFTRFGNKFLLPAARRQRGLDRLDGVYFPEKPTLYATPATPPNDDDNSRFNQEVLHSLVEQEVAKEEAEFHLPTVADYLRAYRSGKITPTDVAEAALTAIAASDMEVPPLRAIIDSCRPIVLAMAQASTQRWREGKTLSILDGVPVTAKGELRIEPYELLSGAVFVSHLADGVPESVMVRKLRDAGAVVIGVANMQEMGMGTIGSNPNPRHLTPRNPYNPQCYAGGSSSGSAVSVAAGLCPIAIGSDGGGSVRIPAATCGVVGLKPTNHSLDTTGILPITYSVSATGPLCSSVTDAAIAMNIFARETDGDKNWLSLDGLGKQGLNGLKVGVYWEYFEDADSEIVDCCMSALDKLQMLGAHVVEIKIPELDDIGVAHFITIVSEFYSALSKDVDDHYEELNAETLAVLSSADHISALEYINAQKLRTRAIESLRYIFEEQKVDIIVTPATGCPAPPIDPAHLSHGCYDPHSSISLFRFSFLANLTGIPGLVLPVGYTDAGLPVSLQLMGGWYQEKVLLKVGWALEQTGAFPARKPKVFYNLIEMAHTKAM